MQKIKLALKVFNSKSKVEKILVRLANEPVPDVSEDKHINPLIEIFRTADLNEERENVFEVFNTYLKNCKGWNSTLKLLYLSHELIDEVGGKFCASFLSEHFENIFSLMKNKDDVEGYVHAVLASNYYNFLISFARYYSDIRTHISREPTSVLKSIQNGDYIGLVELLTFKNVLKYFTKVEECIEGSANVLKERGLINKISLLLFKDVISIYNLISRNLKQTMGKIFGMDSTPALLLDEIYSDMIQITKKLRQLIEKAGLEQAFELPRVEYYTFDSEFNKQEELFILELKKEKSKNPKQAAKQHYQIYMNDYQNFTPGKKLTAQLISKEYELTKGSESNFSKSRFDEDSMAPMKAREDHGICPQQGILMLGENGEFSHRGVNNSVKTKAEAAESKLVDLEDPEYHLGEKKKDLRINCDYSYSHKGGAESVIFTPTSTQARSLVSDETHAKDLVDDLMKTDLQHDLMFGEPNAMKKKGLNVNQFSL